MFCRGPSTTHRTSVDEEVITRRTAGPLHLSHLAPGAPRSRSEDRENRPPGMPSRIPQFLRIPAEREEDGFRLPVIPPPPPVQQAWGPGSQGRGAGGVPSFPLLRLSVGPPQPGVYAPPPHLPYFVPDPSVPAASLLPPPPQLYQQAAAQLRPLSFSHVPPQVRPEFLWSSVMLENVQK